MSVGQSSGRDDHALTVIQGDGEAIDDATTDNWFIAEGGDRDVERAEGAHDLLRHRLKGRADRRPTIRRNGDEFAPMLRLQRLAIPLVKLVPFAARDKDVVVLQLARCRPSLLGSEFRHNHLTNTLFPIRSKRDITIVGNANVLLLSKPRDRDPHVVWLMSGLFAQFHST